MDQRWEGVHEDEPWTIECSYDRFAGTEPFVVDVWIDFLKDDVTRGAFMSPEQAREMADALLRNADACEKANERG